MLEALGLVAHDFVADAACGHPWPDHVEVLVSGRFLDADISSQYQVRDFALRDKLHQKSERNRLAPFAEAVILSRQFESSS